MSTYFYGGYLESFHHILNETLDYHPKLSFLIEKYKIYLKNKFDKIKNSILVKTEKKEEKFSVVNDIFNFISNYNKKYKTDNFS